METVDDLLTYVLFLVQTFEGFEKRHIVELILLEIGIPTEKSSYNFLVESILLYNESPDPMLTKNIYPVVAKKISGYVKSSRIEMALRRSIRFAWENRDNKWQMYFVNECLPSNAAFISRISKILDLWEACCKSVSQKEGSQCKI